MSHKKFLKSKTLLMLDKFGKLDPIFDQFKEEMNLKTFLGARGDVSRFQYKDNQVLKMSSKDIVYFRRFSRRGQVGTQHFKEHIESLQPYFLPVNEVLYEDDNIFIYTQDNCRILKELKREINQEMVLTIFKAIHAMLNRNLFSGAISLRNFGLHNGNVVLFDYHDLHPLDLKDGLIVGEKWEKFIKHTNTYVSYLSGSDKHKHKGIKSLEKQGLSTCFVDLLKYLSAHKNGLGINKDTLVELFNECIHKMSLDNRHRSSRSSERSEVQATAPVASESNENEPKMTKKEREKLEKKENQRLAKTDKETKIKPHEKSLLAKSSEKDKPKEKIIEKGDKKEIKRKSETEVTNASEIKKRPQKENENKKKLESEIKIPIEVKKKPEVTNTSEIKTQKEVKSTEEIKKKPESEIKTQKEVKSTEEIKKKPESEIKTQKEVKSTEEIKTQKEVKSTEEIKPHKETKSIEEIKNKPESEIKTHKEVKSSEEIKTNEENEVKSSEEIKKKSEIKTNRENETKSSEESKKKLENEVKIQKEPHDEMKKISEQETKDSNEKQTVAAHKKDESDDESDNDDESEDDENDEENDDDSSDSDSENENDQRSKSNWVSKIVSDDEN